ncbi:MAG: Ig-like domain-containing protein [Gemmatimonadaceae bacterium]|nr:Ig-like domain-containing protein [Gemmatimonadaceae bacterium]
MPAPTVKQVIVDIDSTVMTVGGRARATAQPLDASGFPISGKTAAWTSGNPAILTIDDSGRVTTVGPGITRVIATIDGVPGDRDVVVRALPTAALIVVAMARQNLRVGDTTRASVALFDSIGTPLAARPVTWSVEGSPTVATVSQSGLVTAIAPGSAQLVATLGTVRGEVDFSVSALPPVTAVVASVAVSIPKSTLRIGENMQASATPLDSAGVPLSVRPIAWSLVSGTGVASVSSAGLVTAVGAGTAQIAATIDGVRGVGNLSVIDTTTIPGPPPPLVVPALPDSFPIVFPQVTGRSIAVHAGDNLQAILASAQRGDEIVIDAGATFSGNFTLPAKAGTAATGWVLIRSSKLAQLPPQGTRVTAAHASLMPRISTPNNQPAIVTALSASGYWIAGIEFSTNPATSVVASIVGLGSAGAAQNAMSLVPSDLVLDRVYVHPQPTQNVQRCVELHSARAAVLDSYLMDCHGKGFDSQAIVGWNGPGPYRIENNTLAGAGENIMFGGADPKVPGVISSDIIIRRNYIYTPPSWKGVWTKKNIFESKASQRVLIEGNVLEGSWTDAQVGYAFILKVANQNGGCTWCISNDITIRDNLIRNVGGAFGITGKDGANPIGQLLSRLLIENNYVDSVNVGVYTGVGRFVDIMNNAQDVIIRRNTMVAPGNLAQFLDLATIPAATNFTYDQNIVSYGTYGLFSSKYGSGEASLQGFNGNVSFAGNVLIGSQRSGYPRARFAPSLSAAMLLGGGADKGRVDAATLNVVVP